MKKNLSYLVAFILGGFLLYGASAFAAPVSNIFRNVLPETDNTYDLGTSTPAARWKNVYGVNANFTNLTVSSCSGCGGGGGGNSFGKSWEINAAGFLAPTTTITTLLNNGFISQASSTVNGNFSITGIFTATSTATSTFSSGLATGGLSSSNGLTITSGGFNVPNAVIQNAALVNSTISGISLGGTLGALTATNSTLTFSGSYTGALAQTVGLNLGNSNIWTALQNSNAAGTTTYSGGIHTGQTLDALGFTGQTLTLAAGAATTTYFQGASTGTSTLAGVFNVLGTNSTSTFSGGLAATYLNLTGATASSTFANGLNLNAGCFSIRGTCLSTGGSSASSTLLSDNNTFSGLDKFTGAATTTFLGGLSAVGLSSSQGLVLTGGQFAITSSATSTSNNGFNISGGCYAINSTCVASSGTLIEETPTGTINGNNAVFSVVNNPVSVFLNGAYQIGAGVDYTLSGTGPYTITFVNAPVTGSNLRTIYGSGSAAGGGSGTVTSVATGAGLTGGTITTTGTLSLDLSATNLWTTTSTTTYKGGVFTVGTFDAKSLSVSQILLGSSAATTSVTGGATTTFAGGGGGLNISAGCFAIANTCISSGAGGSGTVNSGTTGQIPYYASNGTSLTATSTLTITTAQQVSTPAGLVGTPSYTFIGNTNTGIYSPSANRLSISAGGTQVLQAQSGQIISLVDLDANGSTGFYLHNSGGVTSPEFSFVGDTSTGMYQPGIDDSSIGFAGGGVSRMVINTNGLVGIGTTTPSAFLSVQTGLSTGDAFVVATSTNAAVFGVDNDGHRFSSGPAPAISSCGSGSPSVTGDDGVGTITTGTGATSCTITFSKAYRQTPSCQITDDSATISGDISSLSTTAVTFGLGAGLSGGHIYYNCAYHK